MTTEIRPKDLPPVTTPTAGDTITLDGATTRSITYENLAGSGALRSNQHSIGYTAGAGGTVTQATNKSTGVTLNKPSGQITMNNAALAAGTIVSFVLTSSFIGATDVLVLNHISGGTPGSYSLNARSASGSATIDVRNNTAGSLGEAIVIQYAVVRSSNT